MFPHKHHDGNCVHDDHDHDDIDDDDNDDNDDDDDVDNDYGAPHHHLFTLFEALSLSHLLLSLSYYHIIIIIYLLLKLLSLLALSQPVSPRRLLQPKPHQLQRLSLLKYHVIYHCQYDDHDDDDCYKDC